MKICGFIKNYNDAEQLERCLSQLSKFCDLIAVCDDSSTDNSLEIIKKYTDLYIVLPNEFQKELEHKQKLLEFALEKHPDITHFFWVDADEIIEARGIKGIRKLCEFMDEFDIDGFQFHLINLWRSKCWYRLDNAFNDLWKVHLWKNSGQLKFEPKEGLHQLQHPQLTKIMRCNLSIIHYGFSTIDLIVRKYKTYKSFGQLGWSLYRLIDENTLQLAPVNLSWFPEELKPKIEPPTKAMSDEEWKKFL